jgi:hypothetical protein
MDLNFTQPELVIIRNALRNAGPSAHPVLGKIEAALKKFAEPMPMPEGHPDQAIAPNTVRGKTRK